MFVTKNDTTAKAHTTVTNRSISASSSMKNIEKSSIALFCHAPAYPYSKRTVQDPQSDVACCALRPTIRHKGNAFLAVFPAPEHPARFPHVVLIEDENQHALLCDRDFHSRSFSPLDDSALFFLGVDETPSATGRYMLKMISASRM